MKKQVDNDIDLSVSPSEKETVELLQSCARMLGFEYEPKPTPKVKYTDEYFDIGPCF